MRPGAAGVRLWPMRPEDRRALAAITQTPGQEAVVSRFDELPPAARRRHHIHVIGQDGGPVGFFRIDPDFNRRDPRLPRGAHGLRGLLIDAGRQRAGIGKAAFARLPDYTREHYPALKALWLTVDALNAPAIGLYAQSGWTADALPPFPGHDGPERVFRLNLG